MVPASVQGRPRIRRALISSVIAVALVVAIVGGLTAANGISQLEVFAPASGTVQARLSKVEDFLADNSKAVKTELSRMQAEIDGLAEASVTPTPSPTSNRPGEPAQSFTVSGTGADAQFVTLTDGLWVLDVQLENNTECRASGGCSPGPFEVEVDSVDGFGFVEVDSVDGTRSSSFSVWQREIADADWREKVFLRVGMLWNPDLDAGKQIVSVTAASTGEWTLTFRLMIGTALESTTDDG